MHGHDSSSMYVEKGSRAWSESLLSHSYWASQGINIKFGPIIFRSCYLNLILVFLSISSIWVQLNNSQVPRYEYTTNAILKKALRIKGLQIKFSSVIG